MKAGIGWMEKLSDNVSKKEEEPGVLFRGAHHGYRAHSLEKEGRFG